MILQQYDLRLFKSPEGVVRGLTGLLRGCPAAVKGCQKLPRGGSDVVQG